MSLIHRLDRILNFLSPEFTLLGVKVKIPTIMTAWLVGILIGDLSRNYGVNFLAHVFVFLSILAHELGHVYASQKIGIACEKIYLLPIGGVASLEGECKTPKHEFWMAIAGPLVSIVLGTYLFCLIALMNFFGMGNIDHQNPLFLIGVINILLGLFNLLPIWPMDGGRIFNAILWCFLPVLLAKLLTCIVAVILAIGFIVVAVYQHSVMMTITGLLLLFFSSVTLIDAIRKERLVRKIINDPSIAGERPRFELRRLVEDVIYAAANKKNDQTAESVSST